MCHDNVVPRYCAAHLYTEASVGKQASRAKCHKRMTLQLLRFVNLEVRLLLGLIDHQAVKTWGSGGKAPHILNFSIRRRSMVSFRIRPLYPRGNGPQVHIS